MTIIESIITILPKNIHVRSVLIGAHWTVVCSRHCGMAAALTSAQPHGHSGVREAGYLHLKDARELAELAASPNLLEASVGVAAINSLLDVDASTAREVNASEVLIERGRGRNVALVGHFHFIPQLREVASQLWIIEQSPAADEYPAEAAAGLLPRADIIAITGSALVNHTLEGLLALCRPESTVMVLGPSTPLSPILYDYGVNILSGTCVVDEAAVLRTVGQGASFRQVQGVKLLTFTNDNVKG